MGLVNYFGRDDIEKKKGEGAYKQEAFESAVAEVDFNGEDLTLSVYGMCSGTGPDGSFRGKVYADFVLNVTGESLYDERIEPETLIQMADRIEKWMAHPELDIYKYIAANEPSWNTDTLLQDWTKLAKLFRAFGKSGFYLTAWW